MSPRKKTVPAEQPFTISMTGYEVVEKVAKPQGTGAATLVPKKWIGKRVRAVRLDP